MQMTTRRRNRKGGRPLALVSSELLKDRVAISWSWRRLQVAGHDASIHFSAAC